MNYVLDTGVLIELERKNKQIITYLEKLNSADSNLFITIPTLREYYYGIVNKSEKNKNKALDWLEEYGLLNLTPHSAVLFCELRNCLKNAGIEIPISDIMIASIAIENNMALVTNDFHFKRIPGLKTAVV